MCALVTCGPHAAHADGEPQLTRVILAEEAGRTTTVDGRIIVEAADGGLLIEARNGRLWNIEPANIQSREATGDPFAPLSPQELAEELKTEFGSAFQTHLTKHYVICSNAGPEYTEWCGRTFERLFESFLQFWKAAGWELSEPRFPLPAIVVADAEQFRKLANDELGAESTGTQGYFSVRTNRIMLFDLTAGRGRSRPRSREELERQLEAVSANVATVVHEATHQIAFNCGVHTRYADNPLWLTEGLAMFFETPDLRSKIGWRTVGQINPARLNRFRDFASGRRGDDSLATLILSDDRLRDADTAADAYAEAWALTYFLVKNEKRQFVDYLQSLAAKKPLIWGDANARRREFEATFGDVGKLEQRWLRPMQKLRAR